METVGESLQVSYSNHLIRLHTWAAEISAASVSTGAIIVIFLLTGLVFFVSRVLLVTSAAGYMKANAKHTMGMMICLILCLTEVYLLVQITSYVPTGPTTPSYYSDLSLRRLDCLISGKGPNHNMYVHGNPRDCEFGQGKRCTLEEPCTPCSIDETMSEDVKARIRGGVSLEGCNSCQYDVNNKTINSCNHFIDGVGPYCYFRGITRVLELRPCSVEMCCFHDNATRISLGLSRSIEYQGAQGNQ